MGISKYFCEYCEKTFTDTPEARRKHLDSKQHKLLVKLHYDSFKGMRLTHFVSPGAERWLRLQTQRSCSLRKDSNYHVVLLRRLAVAHLARHVSSRICPRTIPSQVPLFHVIAIGTRNLISCRTTGWKSGPKEESATSKGRSAASQPPSFVNPSCGW